MPDDVDARSEEVLPDRHAAMVTYCSKEACPNTGNVAALLSCAGDTIVRTYKEGIHDAIAAGLATESTTATRRAWLNRWAQRGGGAAARTRAVPSRRCRGPGRWVRRGRL